jgi:hypothetical protein
MEDQTGGRQVKDGKGPKARGRSKCEAKTAEGRWMDGWKKGGWIGGARSKKSPPVHWDEQWWSQRSACRLTHHTLAITLSVSDGSISAVH